MEARKESGSFKRGEMSLVHKDRHGDPGVGSCRTEGSPPGQSPRVVRQPHSTGGTTARVGAARLPAGTSDHLAPRSPPAPAPEQHARDREVREAADVPRHQLQVGVRHAASARVSGIAEGPAVPRLRGGGAGQGVGRRDGRNDGRGAKGATRRFLQEVSYFIEFSVSSILRRLRVSWTLNSGVPCLRDAHAGRCAS